MPQIFSDQSEMLDKSLQQCIHYGKCGGCSLQHLTKDAYLEHKYLIFQNAIEAAGFSSDLLPIPIIIGPFSRRRTQLKVQKNAGSIKLGYYQAKSHQIIDIKECHVLDSQITALLTKLKHVISFFRIGIYDIFITFADNGLDILIKSDHMPILNEQEKIAEFANDCDISRISWQNKNQILPIIIRRTPELYIDKVKIPISPNCFLQATKQSEELIRSFIKKYSQSYMNVVDLYSGCGTYSFAMAEYSKVHAVEGEESSINAIKYSKGSINPVSSELRDLYRYPLTSPELNNYQLAVINPPRNGAEPQVRELAKSNINNIIMVSCNPKTFSRDIRILKNSGFLLEETQAIDQFYWSDHLEIIAALSRK